MAWVQVSELEPGMRIELVADQDLWDFSASPWRRYGAGTRHDVLSVTTLATGRTDRQPYELALREAESGARLVLEVLDGRQRVLVVDGDPGGEDPASSTAEERRRHPG